VLGVFLLGVLAGMTLVAAVWFLRAQRVQNWGQPPPPPPTAAQARNEQVWRERQETTSVVRQMKIRRKTLRGRAGVLERKPPPS
jgi:hypothetical protein